MIFRRSKWREMDWVQKQPLQMLLILCMGAWLAGLAHSAPPANSAPTTGLRVLFEDPLNGSTKGKAYGGEFVTGGGWRATGLWDRLVIELPHAAGGVGSFEMDIRNLNIPQQVDQPENHFLGLAETMLFSGGDANLPAIDCFNMYAGQKYPQFKLKYHTGGFARHEGTVEPVEKYDPNHVYHLKVEWRERQFSVSLDGKPFYVQETPQTDPMDRVKFVRIGANWAREKPRGHGTALRGPVFSNVRVSGLVAESEFTPSDVRIQARTPNSLTLAWDEPAAGSPRVFEIYRNGGLVGKVHSNAVFLDARLPEGMHTYKVRGIYAKGTGESGAIRAWVVDNLLKAPAAAVAPDLDGRLAEKQWRLSKQAFLPIAGASDNTVHFGALWDEKNLYLGIKVADARVIGRPENPRQADAIEILIDGNNNGAPSMYSERNFDEHDRLYLITPDNSALYMWQKGKLARVGNDSVLRYAVTRSGDGYEAEMAIPWESLKLKAARGLVVGFDLRQYDNDGTDKTAIVGWSSDLANPLITSAYGDLVLDQ
ncbi:MAG: hypothetical protein N3D11_14275 [Candidatus Sumerlaeia bacterium]|nr:hypothetical protein [Candidatus Sumerlaeia bacterium]